MGTKEMIAEIDKQLKQFPDNVVEQVYSLVKEASSKLDSKLLKDKADLERLFDKYDDVFKRLAQ
jgi:hypothetical protein